MEVRKEFGIVPQMIGREELVVAKPTSRQGFRLGQHKPLELPYSSKKSWFSFGKVLFANALHDPPDLASSAPPGHNSSP